MRNVKLIAVGVGSCGLGAMLAWAFTADHYEAKLQECATLLDEQTKELFQLYQERHRFLTPEEIAKIPFEEGGLPLDEDDEIVQQPRESVVKVPEQGMSSSLRLIQEAALRSEGLSEKLGPTGGHIEVIQQGEEPEGPGIIIQSPIEEVAGVAAPDPGVGIDVGTDEFVEPRPAFPPGETEEETTSRLQALINQYAADPSDTEVFMARTKKLVDPEHAPPYVIPQAEYAYGEDGGDYSKITITYFEKTRLLLDDDQDPIEDVEDFVGWRALNQFGYESGDPDVVFVRNDRLSTDFEVVRDAENDPPIHVRFGMGHAEFEANRRSGNIQLPDEY